MSRRLWEISGEYSQTRAALMNMDLDDETVENTLAAIAGEFNDKAIATAGAIRSMETEAAGCLAVIAEMQKDIDAMKAHPARLKKRADYLRKYLAGEMLRQDMTKVENENGPPITIHKRKNIVLIDEAIPSEYIEMVPKIDRNRAKAAAKLDPSVNWATTAPAPILKIS